MAGRSTKPIEERIAYIQEQIKNSESRLNSLQNQLQDLLNEQQDIQTEQIKTFVKATGISLTEIKEKFGLDVPSEENEKLPMKSTTAKTVVKNKRGRPSKSSKEGTKSVPTSGIVESQPTETTPTAI